MMSWQFSSQREMGNSVVYTVPLFLSPTNYLSLVFFSAVFLFCCAFPLNAQAAGKPNYDYDLFNAEVGRLTNGVPYIVKQRAHSQSVYVRAVFDVGFMNFSCEKQQVAHLVEHMLFQGTSKESEQSIRKTFRLYGGKANGFTFRGMTYYQFEVHRDHLAEALALFQSMLTDSLMTEDVYKRAQEIVRTERGISASRWKQLIGGDEHALFDVNLNRLFADTTLGCLKKPSPFDVSYEEAIAVYEKYYHPKNLTLIAIGDSSQEEMIRLLEKQFGDLTGDGERRMQPPSRTVEHLEEEVRRKKITSNESKVFFALEVPGFGHEDASAVYVLNAYLDETLFNKVRIQQSLGYTPRSRVYGDEFRGFLVAEVKTTPKNLPRVLALFNAEFKSLAEKGIPAAEFEAIKRQTYLRKQTKELKNREVADQYTFHKVQALEQGYMKPVTAAIKNLTRDEVNAAAAKYFQPQPAVAYTKPISLNFLLLYFAGILLVAVLLRRFVMAIRR